RWLTPVANVSHEPLHVLSQHRDAALACRLDVEPDVRGRRSLARVGRTLEVRAHERADGVTVSARLARALRAEEHDVVAQFDVFTPGALRPGAHSAVRLAQQDARGRAVEVDDHVPEIGELSIAPGEKVEAVPIQFLELRRKGEVP